ncbi:MAG TPA: iron ABC transporter permease, partial [Ruminiclostridium sp.]|nr:iron ABC transporter permease [Ruminiclostridium sp.]
RAGQIFYFVRLPRTFAAVLAGAALACSGTILQTVLGNPMCSPNVIGVNSGAGLAMITVAAFFPTAAGFAPVAAFLGALVSVTVVYGIAKKTGASKLAIVLSGIAVSSLFSALTDTIITMVPDVKINRIDFLIGSFSGVTMSNVGFAMPYILTGLLLAFIFHVDINLLALGDSTASSLGVRVRVIRGLFLAIAALLAGSAISLAGLIGFVGLIVPHIAKGLIGYDHKYLLPLSAILGGAFCLFCDVLARTLFIPFEAPVGIVMSLIGSPFFIWLVLTQRRRHPFD